MSDTTKAGPSGRRYKITTFSKECARRKGFPGRHYLALFNPGEVTSTEGWWCNNLRHAKKDGRNFINGEA